MSCKTIERTMRRMLSRKERLNMGDAVRIKELMLADGIISKSEKKMCQYAIENDLLDERAFEVFLDLLLSKREEQPEDLIA